MDICTIIASNYAPFARVLGESFREHHPEARCFVLVIDDHEGRLDPASEPFEIITPAELGIAQFDRMATIYDVLELSTAVKPWLLKHLLNERGCDTLAYLDPDIQVIDRLDEIEALLHEHRLVVTPHLTEPMPRDGRKPSETDILIAGSFNLGFVGMARGEDIDALLDWWSERLETDCIVAPERGFFVDQRWMDFAPGLVPSFHVLRDPGYNVAYWNLSSRRVERTGDRWTVNGRPLRFFHFSGFDPEQPGLLSKHQNRIRLEDEPGVRELCAAYAERLLGHGFRDARGWTYTYNHLADGTPIDQAVRLGYRRAVEDGELPRSPLTDRGARELVRWLAHDGGAGTPNRYLLALHEARADLQQAFPEVPGADGARFTVWAQAFGVTEVPIPAALVPGAAVGAAAAAAPAHVPGVNVAGYFQSVLGVGEAARQVVGALEAGGVAVTQVGLVASRSRQEADLGPGAAAARGANHPVNLICVNADVLTAFADDAGPDFFAGRYSIGLWWWEVSSFPERWLSAFRHVDEVWVGSRHVADALAPVSPVPVVHIVQPVTVADAAPLDRAALGIPNGFLFLFSFDYNSVFPRKNPLAVIEAFTRAFEPGSGPVLVIKSINDEHDQAAHERLRAAAAAHPDVHLVDRYLSGAERDALTAGCDCYVSLHRSEGFGYTVAEAMAYGRPVITTAYGGTMDFTTPGNAYLVDYELVAIGPNADPYPEDGVWADPDVAQTAAFMREVVEHPDEARRRGERARADMRERHAPAVAGKVMADRLARVTAGFGASLSAPGRDLGAFDPRPIHERIARGPQTPDRYRFGAPQRAARKALLRGLKPLSVHEKSIDNDLLRSLEAVDRAVQTLAQSHGLALGRLADDPARIDDLAGQVDRLRADLDAALRFLASFGLGTPAQIAQTTALGLGDWPVAPEQPWSPEYVERHREFVTRALGDPSLLVALRAGRPLPAGYGVGFDERVVEFPWTVTRDLRGRVLDAGSTLNHPHVLIRVRPHVDELHVVTLAPEEEAYPFLDVSYLYADLRELPMQDATYDTAVSISTLEHVGMDNTQYGDSSPRQGDSAAGRAAAMAELHRVLKPGGSLFVTVPYGRPDDLGWQQIFDAAGLQRLVDGFGGTELEREFFRYDAAGWRRASQSEADGAVYRDHFADPAPASDGAPAARAIACLRLRKDG